MGKIKEWRMILPPSQVLLCTVLVEIVAAAVVMAVVRDMENVVVGSMADLMKVMQSLKEVEVFEEKELDTDKEVVEVIKREEKP